MTAAQAELDFIQAHVRNGDPVTSIRAAESVQTAAASQCAAILSILAISDVPMAAEQIADKLGMSTHEIGKRLPDLGQRTAKRNALIRKTDQKHKNRSGLRAFKWEAA